MASLAECVAINPEIRFGKLCILGTRIAVQDILELLAAGEDRASIRKEYELEDQDITAALDYAAKVLSHQTFAAE